MPNVARLSEWRPVFLASQVRVSPPLSRRTEMLLLPNRQSVLPFLFDDCMVLPDLPGFERFRSFTSMVPVYPGAESYRASIRYNQRGITQIDLTVPLSGQITHDARLFAKYTSLPLPMIIDLRFDSGRNAHRELNSLMYSLVDRAVADPISVLWLTNGFGSIAHLAN